jgi:hypothetical protein
MAEKADKSTSFPDRMSEVSSWSAHSLNTQK